jgi:predicted phage terminase large subunit-like protein
LLNRRRARSDLLSFTNFTYPQYAAEPVHALIARTLDRVVEREIKRLMIIAPPQHGKSELASVRLPPFWLGKHPDEPVIVASYGANLAYDKSRQARQIVESDDYRLLFPEVATHPASRAIDHWTLEGRRGGLLAVGVGGPITGHGAGLGLIDDPFENWAQAQSRTIRERVWEWWRTTFRTRIWEGGAIVLIMTRWHEDDLAGRLLATQGEKWTVLRLPALAETQEQRDDNNKRVGLPAGQPDPLGREPDEPLAPGRYSAGELKSIQIDVGELGWNAEYQGAPRAPEGNRIKRWMLRIVEAAPAKAERVRYWDKAGTEDSGKYSAGVLLSRDADKRYCVEDVVRGQWEALQRETVIKQTAQLDALKYGNTVKVRVEQEPGSGGKESAQNTVRLLAGYPVDVDKVTGEKTVRWEPFIAQIQAGNVALLRGAWNADFIEELTLVPNGKYVDQMDAGSGAFNKLTLGDDGQKKTTTAPASVSNAAKLFK